MATKSILKSIHIKDRKKILALVNAMEKASDKKEQPIVHERAFSDASREEIRKMIGKTE